MATINLLPSNTVSNNWSLDASSTDADNALSDSNNNTYITTQVQSRECIVALDNLPANAISVSSVRHYISGFVFNTRGGTTEVQVKLQNTSGTDLWSENHTLNFNSYNPEDHYGTARTTQANTSASPWSIANVNDLRLNINTSPEDPPLLSQARIVKAFVEVTYTTGYENNVIGVASTNISSINGIATADISKVNGV